MSGLDRNEHLFQMLVEAVSDSAIYMLDPDGRVVSWNPGAQRIKGYSREEIEGQPFSRFFTPEDRDAGVPDEILAQARAQGRVESEGWRVRKDGGRFWAQATVHAVRDEAGGLIGFAKVTRDMTAQRDAQHQLIESERRFRYLVEGVVDYSIYMLDEQGIISNWNRGAERIKGYRADEVVGRHFSLFYTPEDREANLPAYALETARREGRYLAEGWRIRKDGERFWASVVIDIIRDDQGVHIGFAKITRDISEARARQEALRQSEREFRLLVSGVVDYALFMIDPEGVVSNWNAGAQNIKGYTAQEIVGQHISRFYTAPEAAAGVPARALQTAKALGRYEAEGWRVRKDGSLFWASVVIDAIRDESGELIGFAKITRDITERRDAQLELQKAQDYLAQAQKMEALGQLTGGVAHDFNNLLMVVSGQAQLLRNKVGDDPRAVRALDAIEMSARRGEDLTRHLLAFARRQRLHPTAIELQSRAGALRELLSASLPVGVTLTVDLPERLWPIEVDLGELELALLNMSVNARDAMPSGGALTITASNAHLNAGEISPDLAGDFVAIVVSDSGDGIPPDILARVFDPFFTTKAVDKGTGLGLSQVYGFVQQSGGQVTLSSELGRGTKLTLYLPRAAAAAAPTAVATPCEAPSNTSILVVEDNPEVAEVAAGLLEQLGNRVRIVGSAEAALKALEEDETPDLVFSDIVMAGAMDGLALARCIRDRHPELPVLLATGYSRSAEGASAEFPILRKPYQLADLSHAIGALLSTPTPEPTDGKLVELAAARRARGERGG